MIIVEHLDSEIFDWSLEEYRHIVEVIGKKNVLFTNVKNSLILSFANCEARKVKELNLGNCCVLDPEAEEILDPSDFERFDNFIFGGILGNNPPEKRTEKLLTNELNFERRNLGKKQMSTDTAVIVVWKILNGKRFSELKFIDDPEILVEKNMSCVMPYRYLDDGLGKPLITKKIMEFIKKEEL